METLPPPLQSMSQDDERLWSVIAHLGALFSSFWVPLIVYLLYKDRSVFVAKHAQEALNFQISMVIYMTLAILLCFTIIGLVVAIPMFVFGGLFHFFATLFATIKASNNEFFEYPLNIRLIK